MMRFKSLPTRWRERRAGQDPHLYRRKRQARFGDVRQGLRKSVRAHDRQRTHKPFHLGAALLDYDEIGGRVRMNSSRAYREESTTRDRGAARALRLQLSGGNKNGCSPPLGSALTRPSVPTPSSLTPRSKLRARRSVSASWRSASVPVTL